MEQRCGHEREGATSIDSSVWLGEGGYELILEPDLKITDEKKRKWQKLLLQKKEESQSRLRVRIRVDSDERLL